MPTWTAIAIAETATPTPKPIAAALAVSSWTSLANALEDSMTALVARMIASWDAESKMASRPTLQPGWPLSSRR